MTIKSGAEIGSLQLVSTDVEFLIIEEGAKVGKITCEGVEYTYQELRAAMGLYCIAVLANTSATASFQNMQDSTMPTRRTMPWP